MAVTAKVGSITCPASTGNQATTGVGFQPKALVFFSFGNVGSDAADTFFDRAQFIFGAATSSSDMWCQAIDMLDNNTTSDTNRRFFTDACIARILGSATQDLRAALVSMDSDGFTVNWSKVLSGTVVYYLALGGDIQAFAGTFDLPSSGATVSETGVGFLPESVLFSYQTENTADLSRADTKFGLGFTDGSASETLYVASEDNAGTSITKRQQLTDAVITIFAESSGAAEARATLSSLDADGFTLSISDNPTAAATVCYLALRGGRFKVGAVSQKTSTGNQAYTGVGFQPVALLLASGGGVSSATVDAENFATVGAATASENANVSFHDKDAAGTMITVRRRSATYCYQQFTAAATATSSTLNARASLSSMDSDGFTLNFATADATAREILYLAVGSAAATFIPKVLVF